MSSVAVKTYTKSSTLHLHLELQVDITEENVHQVLPGLLGDPADNCTSSSNQHQLYQNPDRTSSRSAFLWRGVIQENNSADIEGHRTQQSEVSYNQAVGN